MQDTNDSKAMLARRYNALVFIYVLIFYSFGEISQRYGKYLNKASIYPCLRMFGIRDKCLFPIMSWMESYISLMVPKKSAQSDD